MFVQVSLNKTVVKKLLHPFHSSVSLAPRYSTAFDAKY